MSLRKMLLTLVALLAISVGAWWYFMPGESGIQSGEDVIRAMHESYVGEWYPYLTFRQETIYHSGGERQGSQTWHEALAVPGRLMIKFDSLGSGSGLVFRRDSQFVFQQNELIQAAPRVHDLLVLGFDVYRQPPQETIAKLEGQGYDLSAVYEGEWQGRPAWVVGADSPEDTTASRFWVDREHLYFVRSVTRDPQDGSVSETRFNDYRQIAGGWVAPEVLFYEDGQLTVEEQYSQIETPDSLPEGLFDAQDFRSARW
ncbi:MAG: hypothetical protein U5K31_04470 [Balneolaceae bacterium]|nr:hypothetical protein [Balneolaceae bacterium]